MPAESEHSETLWEVIRWVISIGVVGTLTALVPYFNRVWDYWVTKWSKQSEEEKQKREEEAVFAKEGYSGMVGLLTTRVAELTAQVGKLTEKNEVLQNAEVECRIQQTEMRGELKATKGDLANALKRIGDLEEIVKRLEGDSKSRVSHTTVQPGAVLIDARDSGIGLLDKETGQPMTEEKIEKAQERIERRKPQ